MGAGGGPAVYGATAIPWGIIAIALSVGKKRWGLVYRPMFYSSLLVTAEIRHSYL